MNDAELKLPLPNKLRAPQRRIFCYCQEPGVLVRLRSLGVTVLVGKIREIVKCAPAALKCYDHGAKMYAYGERRELTRAA